MVDCVQEVVRGRGCYVVRLLSGDTLRVPVPVWRAHPLVPGSEVDVSQYLVATEPTSLRAAMEKAVASLARQDRTAGEVSRSLRNSGYSESVIEMVVGRLTAEKYLDDARSIGITVRQGVRKYGPRRIAQRLHARGIDADDIHDAVSSLDDRVLLETALRHAGQYLGRRTHETDAYKKALAFLIRKGYSHDMAREAVRLALDADWE